LYFYKKIICLDLSFEECSCRKEFWIQREFDISSRQPRIRSSEDLISSRSLKNLT
jgi:hypothetical protein